MTPDMIRSLGLFMFIISIKSVLELLNSDIDLLNILTRVSIVIVSLLFILEYALTYPYLG